MRITLIRHAQPDWTPNGVPSNNPALTPHGRDQAESLGRRVAGWSIDQLLVSPMLRCRETAEAIEMTTGMVPEVAPWLEEIRAPEWSKMPRHQVAGYFERLKARSPDDWWEGLPGGESFGEFADRISAGLEAFLAEIGMRRMSTMFEPFDDDRRVVMVAHGGTNSVIVGRLLGIDLVPWQWERFPLQHTSVTILDTVDLAGGTAFALRRFSDVAHLHADARTH